MINPLTGFFKNFKLVNKHRLDSYLASIPRGLHRPCSNEIGAKKGIKLEGEVKKKIANEHGNWWKLIAVANVMLTKWLNNITRCCSSQFVLCGSMTMKRRL